MKHTLIYLLPLSTLVSGLTACTPVYQQERPWNDRAPYYDSTPAYSAYDYYFYPDVAVYFQIATGFYFYQDHGHWFRSRQLPPSFHLDSRHRRQLVIRDAYPYTRYPEHARLYGTREDEHRDDRRPGSPDGDRHEGAPERSPATEDRQFRPPVGGTTPAEQREPIPTENRVQDARGPGLPPSRTQESDQRTQKSQSTTRDDDKPQAHDRSRSPEEQTDARRPSRDKASAGKPHGRGEPDASDDTSTADQADESPEHTPESQDDAGRKRHPPGSPDDDDADRDYRAH